MVLALEENASFSFAAPYVLRCFHNTDLEIGQRCQWGSRKVPEKGAYHYHQYFQHNNNNGNIDNNNNNNDNDNNNE